MRHPGCHLAHCSQPGRTDQAHLSHLLGLDPLLKFLVQPCVADRNGCLRGQQLQQLHIFVLEHLLWPVIQHRQRANDLPFELQRHPGHCLELGLAVRQQPSRPGIVILHYDRFSKGRHPSRHPCHERDLDALHVFPGGIRDHNINDLLRFVVQSQLSPACPHQVAGAVGQAREQGIQVQVPGNVERGVAHSLQLADAVCQLLGALTRFFVQAHVLEQAGHLAGDHDQQLFVWLAKSVGLAADQHQRADDAPAVFERHGQLRAKIGMDRVITWRGAHVSGAHRQAALNRPPHQAAFHGHFPGRHQARTAPIFLQHFSIRREQQHRRPIGFEGPAQAQHHPAGQFILGLALIGVHPQRSRGSQVVEQRQLLQVMGHFAQDDGALHVIGQARHPFAGMG